MALTCTLFALSLLTSCNAFTVKRHRPTTLSRAHFVFEDNEGNCYFTIRSSELYVYDQNCNSAYHHYDYASSKIKFEKGFNKKCVTANESYLFCAMYSTNYNDNRTIIEIFDKSLSLAYDKPFIGINHLNAHLAANFIDTDLESRWNVFYILEVQHYLVYFFFGIFFFRFELYKYIGNIGALLILVLLYAACYYFSLDYLISIIGIFMMCSLCLRIGQYFPNLFSSFREYIFQIYLMSLPFQTFVELILWKKVFYNEQLFFVFYALNLLFGLYIPVLISKLVERCPIKPIRLCFGLQ